MVLAVFWVTAITYQWLITYQNWHRNGFLIAVKETEPLNTLVSFYSHYPLLCQQPREHHEFLNSSKIITEHNTASFTHHLYGQRFWRTEMGTQVPQCIWGCYFLPSCHSQAQEDPACDCASVPVGRNCSTAAPRGEGTAPGSAGLGAERQRAAQTQLKRTHCGALRSGRSVSDKSGQLQGQMASEQKSLEQ